MIVTVTREDFDINRLIEERKAPDMGAVVSFIGVVRDDGIERIELEAHQEVAVEELEAIRDEAFAKFPIKSVDIIHRIGDLNIGDNIVLILVGAGHRREAFEGCEYIIERLKERVPIWKKEYTKDGERWVQGEHH
ncbi:MAG: Molybdopterin biosynthesis MoaE [Methanomicrobiales archaeon 53_19]|jgi:molybdopterin synthase catalytic subunit|uniref:molybdenum cofactor biosynthesis protein MoaE n=1 Tax=Methanocalculus sp. TaxID=2004547 RepID=UPI00074750A4|nr:MAG: Molybdopterin biosynthesis MoaE [Methanocalculus sp. 52_23]KUL03219.1 MAG: Molybdopterin biosynthesis MoaE [Methanomicrobiales archaeon 53_19]HIJ06550.1 molybdenum cofactor biosynthesis protein MoaE [Methanocalculus sp.]